MQTTPFLSHTWLWGQRRERIKRGWGKIDGKRKKNTVRLKKPHMLHLFCSWRIEILKDWWPKKKTQTVFFTDWLLVRRPSSHTQLLKHFLKLCLDQRNFRRSLFFQRHLMFLNWASQVTLNSPPLLRLAWFITVIVSLQCWSSPRY